MSGRPRVRPRPQRRDEWMRAYAEDRHAWECLEKVAREDRPRRDAFRRVAEELPLLLRRGGLACTLCGLRERADRDDGASARVLEHLDTVLAPALQHAVGRPAGAAEAGTDLVDTVARVRPDGYLLLSRVALRAANALRLYLPVLAESEKQA